MISPRPSPTSLATAAATPAAPRSPSTADSPPNLGVPACVSLALRRFLSQRRRVYLGADIHGMISRGGGMSQQPDVMPDSGEFADLTEPFRRELLAHCYRMLGSVTDAEGVVQGTDLRGWRSYGGFEGRSSVRTWLYQIATNTCLTARQHRTRRALPSGLGGPGEDHESGSEFGWLQPIPDALVTGEANDPAVIAVTRDSLRLALIASFQYLPHRQRAVLLLREVLAFPAQDVARMLGTTTVAVKSALQRARARLSDVAPAGRQLAEPSEPAARALLEAYIAAFEHADAAALERLLRQGAVLELSPFSVWV